MTPGEEEMGAQIMSASVPLGAAQNRSIRKAGLDPAITSGVTPPAFHVRHCLLTVGADADCPQGEQGRKASAHKGNREEGWEERVESALT